MKTLEYVGLDTACCEAQYRKVVAAIERDDFRSAEVKKLAGAGPGKLYRAKLDAAARLLFSVIRHGETVYALMLEVLPTHDYDRSRFLRGAEVDEARLPAVDATEAQRAADPVRYVHPARREVHLLDKVISFDDAQEAVYRVPPPLIVVGSAGSGKTALTLEKMKHTEGEVLYLTLSPYLAQSARDLYYGHGFEKEGQEVTFFSYRDLLESIRVPPGREVTWQAFASWFARLRQAFRGIEAHQAFEELRGVIAADAGGVLTREAYRALGVRQSIFPVEDRDRLYDLFEKYRAWLAEARLYDASLVAHAWREAAEPRYDFLVVDEVQDLTNAQLALALATLRKPGHFLLCGDSNQIVHPNFFSWGRVKSLFWRDPELADRQQLHVLRANFRNALETTRVANALLKLKHARFGSIDRESNFLVDAMAGDGGRVTLLADREATKRELDLKTRASTDFAVLVLRDEDKAEARRFFRTPLLFAIHEAKGLEYESIVLYRFVSDHRAEFSEIAAGVTAEDLAGNTLEYRRARDKADKSIEVYKFYVNALYVALTRAVRNVFLIESDASHELLRLLGLQAHGERVEVEARTATREDWQREARRLELQGKQEQADAIRETILQQVPPPWPVLDETRLRELLVTVFRERKPGAKLRQQLYEYATAYDEPVLAQHLSEEADYAPARQFARQRASLGYKHLMPYYVRSARDILRQCDQHGVEHRTPMNLTPLMAAVVAGNIPLVETLLDRGADPQATDHLGRNALHWALLEAARDAKYAKGPLAALYERIAPAAVDLLVGGRLVRIDRHLSEYFLLQTLWVLYKNRFTGARREGPAAFNTATVLEAWRHLPPSVLRPERNRRAYLSSVLSRNEVDRDYAYNRRLFRRVSQGWYRLDPTLAVRRQTAEGQAWVPIVEALNLRLVKELAAPPWWAPLDAALAAAGVPPAGVPVALEEKVRQWEAEQARERRERERAAAPRPQARRPRSARSDLGRPATPAPEEERPAPWGTPGARRQAVERLRRQLAEQERLRKDKDEKG
jgi:hypothetical protein